MSTNIIEGFEISNDLKITDGPVSFATNDITVSLDVSANMIIGDTEKETKNTLIIKNKNKAEINLIAKNSLDTESIHKISNKNGGLLFESENSAIDYARYEFDVGAGDSVGIMKGPVDNYSGIVFGKNSDQLNGAITSYKTPHLGYKQDDHMLVLTSENYRFNLSNNEYLTVNPFSTLNQTGLSIGTEFPNNRLSIYGNVDTDVSMCIVSVGNSSYKSAGIWLGAHFSENGPSKIKTAIICDQASVNHDGTTKLHFCLDDSTDAGDVNVNHSKVSIQPNGFVGIGTTSPQKTLHVNGDVKAGEINSYDCVKIVNDSNTILLDISGVSAIRIPSGNNLGDKTSMVLNSLPGYMRFNTTLSQFEGYNGFDWTSLGGVRSLDQNTYIDADNTNGLTFIQSGQSKINIKNNNICFGSVDPSHNFHFIGNTNDESSIRVSNSSAGTSYISLQKNIDNSAQIINTGNSNLIIATNNQDGLNSSAPQLYLSETNNHIGIGTNDPRGMLFINDDQEIEDNIVLNLFSSAIDTGKSYTILKLEKGTNYGGSIKGFINQNVHSGLEFSTQNGNTEKTVMTMLNNGNIGFGEESPNNKFVIDGGIYHTSSSKDVYYDTSDYSYSTVITGGNQFQRSSGSSGAISNYEAQPILILKRPGYSSGSQMKPAAAEFKIGQVDTFYDYPKSKLQIDLLGGGGDTLGAVNVMTLQHDVKVGIGTDSPRRELEVETTNTGSGWNSSFVVGNTSNKFIAGVYNNEVLIGGHNGSLTSWRDIRINDNGNIKLCAVTGYVGIGNGDGVSPQYKLDLRKKNTDSATSYILLDCGNNSSNVGESLDFDYGQAVNSGNAGGGLYWKPNYDQGSNTYSKHSAAIRFRSEGNYFRGGIDFMTNNTRDTTTDCTTRFRIGGNGFTVVGSKNPTAPFSVTNGTSTDRDFNDESQDIGIHMGLYAGSLPCINMVSDNMGGPWIDFKPTSRHGTTYKNFHGRLRYNMNHQNGSFQFATNKSNRVVFNGNGHCGINVASPSYPLEVDGYTNSPDASVTPYYMWRYSDGTNIANQRFSSSGQYEYVAIRSHHTVMADRYTVVSDRRVKKNIREVPDHLSLEKLRKIECKYYDYIDSEIKGSDTTIGFIAQQVREHMPMATGIVSDFIPNKLCLLKNIKWVETDDKFIMSTPELPDVSGVEYRFHVGEEINSEETIINLTGNSDNTFTFEKKWRVIFCYGKRVNDFHTLDKQKLFALNFSASQELDRNQQTLLKETKELKETVKRQNDIIFELSSKIEGLMSRITQLEMMR